MGKAGLERLNISDLCGMEYSCGCGQKHSLETKHILVKRGCINSLNRILSGIAPAMRIAVISGSKNFIRSGHIVQSCVDTRSFTQVNFIFDDGVAPTIEKASQLFSLPEDVRAVVSLGAGNELPLAKYYSEVMGVPHIIIPLQADMEGVFTDFVEIGLDDDNERIRISAPYAVVLDPDLLDESGDAAAFGSLTGRYISLLDYKIAALTKAENFCVNVHNMLKGALKGALRPGLKTEKLAELSLRASAADYFSKNAFSRGALDSFSFILSKKYGANKGVLEYLGFLKLIKVYKLYMANDTEFCAGLPNFSDRAEKAKSLAGLSERALLKKLAIVPPKVQKGREEAVGKFKRYFEAEIDEILRDLPRIRETMKGFGAALPDIKREDYIEAFLYSPDLTGVYTLSVLLRDNGLLDNMEERLNCNG